MIVQLVLTEKMMKYIYKGEFQQLLNEYQEFFKELADNLKNVAFPKKHLAGLITTEFKFLLKFLEHPRSSDPKCSFGWVHSFQKFFNHLKYGIVLHDWRSFYETYRPTADYMIRQARMQGILDFRIEFGSDLCENFEARDLALVAEKQEAAQKLLRSSHRLSRFFSRGKYHKPSEVETEIVAATGTMNEAEHQTAEPAKIEKLMPNDRIEPSKTESEAPIDILKKYIQLELSSLKTELEGSFSDKLKEIHKNLGHHMEVNNSRIAFNRNDIQLKFNEFVKNVERKQSERNATLRENHEKELQNLEAKIQEQLKTQEEQMELREEKLRTMEENLKVKKFEGIGGICSKEELLDAKLKVVTEIQKRLELLGDQMKLREEKLKSMEKTLEEKLNQIEQREAHIDTKFNNVLELLRLNIEFERQDTKEDTLIAIVSQSGDPVLNIIEIAELGSENRQSVTDPTSEFDLPTPSIKVICPNTTSIESLKNKESETEVTPTSQLSYEEEIQQMEDEFQKKLAEQKNANDLELRRVQEQRREKNKKYQVGLRHRFGNLYTDAGSSGL